MIRIIYNEFDGSAISVRVTGHAGYAEDGKDIVCAGVSTLLCTLAENVERLTTKHTIRMDKGDAIVSCIPSENYMIETVITFGTILRGFRLMADAYPEYVTLEE